MGEVPVSDKLNVSLDYLAIRTLQSALKQVAESGSIDCEIKRDKLLPVKTAFAVRDAAVRRTAGVDRSHLPAFGDFLLEEDVETQLQRYSEQYRNDLVALQGISQYPLDVDRFLRRFDARRILQARNAELRDEYPRQAELAKEIALKVLQDIETPGISTRVRAGIKGSSLLRKVLRP